MKSLNSESIDFKCFKEISLFSAFLAVTSLVVVSVKFLRKIVQVIK